MDSDIEIFTSALFAVGDSAALARVRQHAASLLAAFDRDEIDFALDEQQAGLLAANPQWVGEVYAALGAEDDAAEQSDVQQAIAEMMRDEARQIGEAFAMLAEGLADSGYDWTRRFQPLRDAGIPLPMHMHLIEDETVQHGGDAARRLFDAGLTPAMIYGATRGLYLQFSRVSRLLAGDAELPPRYTDPAEAAFFMGRNPRGEVAFLPRALAQAGIAGTRDLPAAAVEPLLGWIKDVLPLAPLLIEGYSWDGAIDGIDILVPVAQRPADLVAQWSLQRAPILDLAEAHPAVPHRWLSDA